MSDKFHDAHNKDSDRDIKKMSMAFTVEDAKDMGRFLLKKEHQGPGDTIESAAYRLQTKHSVPATLLLRLWNRDVNDMLLSNFAAVANAYIAVKARIDSAYEHEKSLAVDTKITRFAHFVAGEKVEG